MFLQHDNSDTDCDLPHIKVTRSEQAKEETPWNWKSLFRYVYVFNRKPVKLSGIRGFKYNFYFPTMRPLFVFNKVPITSDGLYDILPANYSPQGSNKREKEELVIIQWIELTQYIEGMLFQLLLCNAKITLQ